jgi:hypothetical protein
MTRKSLNLVAAAVVLAGSAWLAAPTPALASAMAQCTTTVTQPDGTITTIVIEGNVCVSDSHLTKCTCW